MLKKSTLFILIASLNMLVIAQDGNKALHLYRPSEERISTVDSSVDTNMIPDTVTAIVEDTLPQLPMVNVDSLLARQRFIEDSILAREAFVRDSLERRQRMLDSLNHLRVQLPPILDASLKTWSNEIIFKTSDIHIIGDSTLSNFEADKITFDFSAPYTPWKTQIDLSDRVPQITFDENRKMITSINCPQFNYQYSYSKSRDILILHSKSSILNRSGAKVYKVPVDSVFLDIYGRVAKIKKYVQYHQVINNYQRGTKLYTALEWLKQFEYTPQGEMTLYEQTRFCERRKAADPQKVCNIVRYEITPKGDEYLIARKNSPANAYSDGLFTYRYQNGHLSEVSFVNESGSEKRKTIIEVNKEGNVSRYLYDKDGKINQTLLVNYLDAKSGKKKVETITCIFEDDGISYYQKNNATGKSRSRDKMTLEWTDWR